jgi:hypothetical protein
VRLARTTAHIFVHIQALDQAVWRRFTNVPFQQECDLAHRHDDEQLEEFGSRWRTAFKRRFGRHFKITTTNNMEDLIGALANEYVKTHLAALKLRKFEDVMRHGRRLEHAAAQLGLLLRCGPRQSAAISNQSDYVKRRECARVFATSHPQSEKTLKQSRHSSRYVVGAAFNVSIRPS